jgi:hypothetical protein
MGKFEDFVRALPTDIELPVGLLSGLQDAYNHDIAEKDNEISVRDTKIEDTNKTVAELTGNVTELKLKNYDLLMGTAVKTPDGTKNPQSENTDEDNKTGVDSLFE